MRILTTILIIFISVSVMGQVVNIENRRVNDGTYGFSGALDFTVSAQQQKDMLVTFHLKPLVQYKFNSLKDFKIRKEAEIKDSVAHKIDSSLVDELKIDLKEKDEEIEDKNKHMLLLINDLKYTGARKNTYANFGMIHLRYAYRIGTTPLKLESYYQIQYNQLLLQKVRTIVGIGFRHKFLDTKPEDGGYEKRAIRLFAGTSVYYEYEEIKYDFRPMEYLNAVRWSTYISSYLNFKKFEISSTTYFQPNLASFKDHRVSGDYALLLRISDPFSVKINFSHFYDSKPPETVNKGTFSLSAGFVYKLDKFNLQQLQRTKKEKVERVKREKETFD